MRALPHYLLPLLLCCHPVSAHSLTKPQDPPSVTSYQGKVYFLRSLCGDTALDYSFDGKLTSACHQPVAFTLDAVYIKTIKFKHDKLLIECEKDGVYLDPTEHADSPTQAQLHTVPLSQKLTLTIHGSPGEVGEEDFAAAMHAVFAMTYADLFPNGPPLQGAYKAAPHAPVLLTRPPHEEHEAAEDSVSPPKLLHSVEPGFTPEARKQHISGTVLIGLTISTDGLPMNVRVIHGLGAGLDEAAVAAVMKYRFKPAEKAGKPVPAKIAVEVRFHIE